MGTFDISRINFDAKKHYASARMQQGRVLTDDDWNEDKRIAEFERKESLIDIIGPYGTPDDGFHIENLRLDLDSSGNPNLINFDIEPGTMYLGGLKLDLETKETFRLQKDWLQQKISSSLAPIFVGKVQYDLVYMEAWQQAISATEDSSLFEVALGGPDTTTRLRNMRRVKLASGIGFCQCIDAWEQLKTNFATNNLGKINADYERIADNKLRVTFANNALPEDLCTPNAAGGYLGAENQAIRVQLFDETSFTWGFDNSAPFYRVAVAADKVTVTMLTEPKDQYHWPLSNQIVEILPWSSALSNGEKVAALSGHLSKVNASYNPDTGQFTMQAALAAAFGQEWKSRADKGELDNQNPEEYFYMRVWNRGSDMTSAPNIPFVSGTAVALGNTGLEITISGTDRQSNDYWVIAARPETPNRVVPWELETGIKAHGIRRYYAPLAVIKWTLGPNNNVIGEIIHDCRKKFHPLTEQECCCTFTVGDGKTSHGDFDTIQEAIDNLPLNGGKICVLPGIHYAQVRIVNKRQIRITGCGDQSIVLPIKKGERLAENIFLIQNSQKIQIDSLTIVSLNGICIAAIDDPKLKIVSENIKINENNIIAGIHAIYIQMNEDIGGDNHISILYNKIGIIDTDKGKVAIFSVADGVLIERNRIVLIAAPNRDPNDPRDPGDPNGGDPFDPCKDPDIIARYGFSMTFIVYNLVKYVTIYYPISKFEKKYAALGGIQIGGTSERVRILENEIIGGKGNGITLGHVHSDAKYDFKAVSSNYQYSPLYEISIEGNHILEMGLSGISTLLNIGNDITYVFIDDLTIYRNLIRGCVHQLSGLDNQKELDTFWSFGGIVLNDCTDAKVQENRIEENGQILGAPICGVFVFFGEEIDVSTNLIFNNGLPIIEDDTNTIKGNRGGVVIKMTSLIGILQKIKDGSEIPFFDGIPSVKIHDNIVVQPCGFALYLIAFGPVSVVSNQFTSLGRDPKNVQSFLASTVFLFNLGVSKDLFVLLFANLANSSKNYAAMATNPSFQKAFKALQYLPNGKVMFTGNQSTLDMRYPSSNISFSSQLIASLDDVAFNTNQTELAGFLSVMKEEFTFDAVFFNTVLFGVSVRSNDNRFSDGFTFTLYSLLSYGLMNTATGNQSTHCLNVIGAKKEKNSNIVLIDDLCKDKEDQIAGRMGVNN